MSEDTQDEWEPRFEALGRKLEAITEYLTVFGYLDGELAPREREFIQSYLERLARRRASEVGEPRSREERGQRWTERLLAYFTVFERRVAQVHASLAVEGTDGRRFVLAELKLQCARTFQRLDREGRAELLALADEFISADSVVHPKEAAFRAELSALLDAPLLADDAAEPPAEEEGALLVERREVRVVVSCDRPLGPALARRLEVLLEELGAGGTAVTLDLGGAESISNAGLQGHVLPGHPLTQQNVIPPSTIASIAGLLFAGLHQEALSR